NAAIGPFDGGHLELLGCAAGRWGGKHDCGDAQVSGASGCQSRLDDRRQCPGRRDRVESDYLVLRNPFVVVPRVDRRFGGRWSRRRGRRVHWNKLVDKVAIPMVASPLIGFVCAFLVMTA